MKLSFGMTQESENKNMFLLQLSCLQSKKIWRGRGQHMAYVFQYTLNFLLPGTGHNVEIMKALVPVGLSIPQLLHLWLREYGRRKGPKWQHSLKPALKQSLIERAVKQDLNNCNISNRQANVEEGNAQGCIPRQETTSDWSLLREW